MEVYETGLNVPSPKIQFKAVIVKVPSTPPVSTLFLPLPAVKGGHLDSAW